MPANDPAASAPAEVPIPVSYDDQPPAGDTTSNGDATNGEFDHPRKTFDPAEPIVYEEVAPVEVPVAYKGRAYVLREASMGAATTYRNAQMKAGRRDKDGELAMIDGGASLGPLLVSLCLFRCDNKGRLPRQADGAPHLSARVQEAELSAWPTPLVDKLFERALIIGKLDPTSEAGLRATIASLQDRLAAVLAAKGVEGDPKN